MNHSEGARERIKMCFVCLLLGKKTKYYSQLLIEIVNKKCLNHIVGHSTLIKIKSGANTIGLKILLLIISILSTYICNFILLSKSAPCL